MYKNNVRVLLSRNLNFIPLKSYELDFVISENYFGFYPMHQESLPESFHLLKLFYMYLYFYLSNDLNMKTESALFHVFGNM